MNNKNAVLSGFYILLLIYASLFPFQGWHIPDDMFEWFALKLPSQVSKSDTVVNILAYIPFGFLAMATFSQKKADFASFYLALLLGMGISFSMETLQTFLPNRTPSILDFITNSSGTLIGIGFACISHQTGFHITTLGKWRKDHLIPDHSLGLAIICCWALSQLAPFVPTVGFGDIKNGIKPIWHTLHNLTQFKPADAAVYGCFIAALGVIAGGLARNKTHPLSIHLCFGGFTAMVLGAKVFSGRQLSLEALIGTTVGVMLAALLVRLPRRVSCYSSMALIVGGIIIAELKPGSTTGLADGFNWLPFYHQIKNEIVGFETIIEGIWPAMALSYLLLLQKPQRPIMGIGGAILFVGVLALEWQQLAIPGRTADVTQPILAAVGWEISLLYHHSSRL